MTDTSDREDEMTPKVSDPQEGVKDTFATLMQRYEGVVYAVILGYLHSRDEALDLTQEVFLRVYRSFKTLKNPSKFPAWVGTIARNTALDHLKKHRRERTLLEDEAVLDVETSRFTEEEIDTALAAIEGLDEIYRIPFMLKYMEEKSVIEIGNILDIPTSTVEGRLYQARLNLRRKLAGKEGAR